MILRGTISRWLLIADFNQAPADGELSSLKRGAVLIGMLEPFNTEQAAKLAAAGVTGFALRPRRARHARRASTCRARRRTSPATNYPRFMPMLMTVAGTVKAARVLILGAGVAGLQAIATAKRLGAVIEASDVRPAVKEQIESLGAKFLDVPYETQEEREAAEGASAATRGRCRRRGLRGRRRSSTSARSRPTS